jgi:uncharacterized protein
MKKHFGVRNLTIRIFLFIVGMAIIQLGVAIALVTNIGSDSFTVFNQGLAVFMNLTPGRANMIILFVYICLILIYGRKYLNIGTFICLAGVGPVIDLLITMLSGLHIEQYNIIGKCMVVILASFIISIGFSILSATKLGVAPNDIIPFLIKDKVKTQYKWIRMGFDFFYICIGFILGGKVGIGTIVFALSLGPVIQLLLPYGEDFVNCLTSKTNKQLCRMVSKERLSSYVK